MLIATSVPTTPAPDTLVLADEHGVEQRRVARRLDASRIRSVHTFYEEDGRLSLVFKGRGMRRVSIDATALADESTRNGLARLVAAVRARGSRVAAGVDELLRSAAPTR